MTLRPIELNIQKNLARLSREFDKLPNDAYPEFKRRTPIKTGNARRSTHLRGNVIGADYAYSVPLNTGSSKQATEGMTTPTIAFIRTRIRRILGKF